MREHLEFKNYKHKEFPLKAVRFDGTMKMAENLIIEGFPMRIKRLRHKWKLIYHHPTVKAYEVKKGDYVAKTHNGDTWVMSEDTFEYFYELIKEQK